MSKAYVTNYKEEPQEGGKPTEVTMEFDPASQNAAIWETRGQAEDACRNYESLPITISGRGACKGFTVEELGPKQFVVFCDHPSQP